MYIFYFSEHNTIIKLIIVEQRVLINYFSLLIFEQRYIIVFKILLYVGDKNILCVCRLYLFFYILIYGQIICNIFELRLFVYLKNFSSGYY